MYRPETVQLLGLSGVFGGSGSGAGVMLDFTVVLQTPFKFVEVISGDVLDGEVAGDVGEGDAFLAFAFEVFDCVGDLSEDVGAGVVGLGG